MRAKYPKLKFNTLRMYFGKPYVIDLDGRNGSIRVNDPGMRAAFIDADENEFRSTLSIFTTNTTAVRAYLWDLGLDWNEVTDFELFRKLYKQADPEICRLLFGDLDIQGFEETQERNLDTNETRIVLYNRSADVMIDEDVYQHIHQYLQCLFMNMAPEEELTDDKFLKDWWIQKDQRNLELMKTKKKSEYDDYSIQPLISACVNHPGFKYKLHEVENMGVAEFYDSVKRLQIYESFRALMNGAYSGFADLSKVPKEQFDWMRNINH